MSTHDPAAKFEWVDPGFAVPRGDYDAMAKIAAERGLSIESVAMQTAKGLSAASGFEHVWGVSMKTLKSDFIALVRKETP